MGTAWPGRSSYCLLHASVNLIEDCSPPHAMALSWIRVWQIACVTRTAHSARTDRSARCEVPDVPTLAPPTCAKPRDLGAGAEALVAAEVKELRAQARNASLAPHARSAASWQLRQRHEEVCQLMLGGAGVVVASCVGAHQLVEAGAADFPLVVLDEGSQATEPALVTALAAARASQLVIVGDTRQLPPTVTSADAGLRRSLGRSPMARLEELGVAQRTLNVQYRMPPALLEHPSRHFYDSLVRCADDAPAPRPPPSCLLYTSPSPRDKRQSRMPSSA